MGAPGRRLARLFQGDAEVVELLATELGGNLGEELGLLLLHVVADALDEDRDLGIEALV